MFPYILFAGIVTAALVIGLYIRPKPKPKTK